MLTMFVNNQLTGKKAKVGNKTIDEATMVGIAGSDAACAGNQGSDEENVVFGHLKGKDGEEAKTVDGTLLGKEMVTGTTVVGEEAINGVAMVDLADDEAARVDDDDAASEDDDDAANQDDYMASDEEENLDGKRAEDRANDGMLAGDEMAGSATVVGERAVDVLTIVVIADDDAANQDDYMASDEEENLDGKRAEDRANDGMVVDNEMAGSATVVGERAVDVLTIV
ncbi:MAG: hypothetical protein ACRDL7_12795, partial [Gaiellaceae bacterium]